ncbi:hypothetical protein [Microvirga sp. 17 mud 1-3]|uniref:hypothetical protein n=1 Tax=Microvirga sp. 17 mud 1-3 TaxID=2082949 RepID=UPI000D6B71E9|nr:hypothetical protein [Microvirga sp. 17 mud 1-3]AWM88621.1 hypothetical protein C4E04_19050 [Microvirga sp. 17 mud 1-3]
MATLRDFITNRRAEIKQEIARLRTELRELDVVESTLNNVPLHQPTVRVSATVVPGRSEEASKTLKEMAVEVLSDRPEGADANQILKAIHERFGVEVARSSLSPQLSRLGHEGVLERDSFIWKLRKFASAAVESTAPKENEPSNEMLNGSETGSEDGYQPSEELSSDASSRTDIFS